MPFVSRNASGEITSLHQEASEEAQEELALNHPDILAFLGTQDGATQTLLDLSRSDMEMARVIEDVVELLVMNGTITLDQLPLAAQEKLNRRQTWRGSLEEALEMFGGSKVI